MRRLFDSRPAIARGPKGAGNEMSHHALSGETVKPAYSAWEFDQRPFRAFADHEEVRLTECISSGEGHYGVTIDRLAVSIDLAPLAPVDGQTTVKASKTATGVASQPMTGLFSRLSPDCSNRLRCAAARGMLSRMRRRRLPTGSTEV